MTAKRLIPVCIDYDARPHEDVMVHEIGHAQQQCDGSSPTITATNCVVRETAAHKLNCDLAKKEGRITDVERCVRCGVKKSCKPFGVGQGPPPGDPKCSWKDMGISGAGDDTW